MNIEILLKAAGIDVKQLTADYQGFMESFRETLKHFDTRFLSLERSNTELKAQVELLVQEIQNGHADRIAGARAAPNDSNHLNTAAAQQ